MDALAFVLPPRQGALKILIRKWSAAMHQGTGKSTFAGFKILVKTLLRKKRESSRYIFIAICWIQWTTLMKARKHCFPLTPSTHTNSSFLSIYYLNTDQNWSRINKQFLSPRLCQCTQKASLKNIWVSIHVTTSENSGGSHSGNFLLELKRRIWCLKSYFYIKPMLSPIPEYLILLFEESSAMKKL